jgi:O-antigen/teichoic acid export membrane protein
MQETIGLKRLRYTVFKNASANIVRGGASAVVALVLPHFLTHDLSVAGYSAWVLMLQIAAWSNFLDFGLQTAVARHVAQTMERGDTEMRDRVISTALLLLIGAGALVMSMALVVVWQMPSLFHTAPLSLIAELRGGVLILSIAAASLLPLSTFTGILVGLHRNEFPALAIGGTRLLGAFGVLWLVRFTHSLLWLALCLGAFNLFGGIMQYAFARRLLPGMKISLGRVTRPIARELAHYCVGLTAFNFGMLLVSGLDLTVVGYFAFYATGYYGVASTAISFLTGLTGAIFSSLLAPLAVLQERGDYSRIRDIVISTTRLGSYASLAIVLVVILAGKPLVTIWVGPQYASQALPILEILLWAQAIRLTGSAYSVALIATAQQKYGIAAALAEGLTNLVASILGAYFLGPIGVAWGTFVGAVCGFSCVIFWVMRRAVEIPVHRSAFASEAILRPLFCFSPLLLYVAVREKVRPELEYLIAAVAISALLLVWAGRIRNGPLESTPKYG